MDFVLTVVPLASTLVLIFVFLRLGTKANGSTADAGTASHGVVTAEALFEAWHGSDMDLEAWKTQHTG